MIENLVGNWRANCSINLGLLEAIVEENLELSAGKARTVSQNFLHMASVRFQWLKAIAPDLIKANTKAEKSDKKSQPSKKDIRAALEQSANAVKLLIQRTTDPEGKLKGYKPDLMAFVFYLVAHDAHHRGQIVLTLRLCNHRLDEKVTYGIWEWAKHIQKKINIEKFYAD
jgi:uncharacterized damage-inducible protein DinB